LAALLGGLVADAEAFGGLREAVAAEAGGVDQPAVVAADGAGTHREGEDRVAAQLGFAGVRVPGLEGLAGVACAAEAMGTVALAVQLVELASTRGTREHSRSLSGEVPRPTRRSVSGPIGPLTSAASTVSEGQNRLAQLAGKPRS
jgi:hypothetical protein